MTITEYYENYRSNRKYKPTFFSGKDETINDFYDNCIEKHIQELDINYVLAWHNMLVNYINREENDQVFWVRYYESGNKQNGRWNNRRACKTEFKDGFSYVFVSNYDAHEILNMVRLKVEPDVEEFTKLMKEHTFPLHYDSGKSCEESDICTYPKIGTVRGGILTPEHWYLAHIIGVKSPYYDTTGNVIDFDVNRVFPRGELSDWKTNNEVTVRRINDILTKEEKEIVKAHFLRFVDPLNYYVVPGKNCQSSKYFKGQIGEYECINNYMRDKFRQKYKHKYKEFEQIALAPVSNLSDGNISIDIEYGLHITTTKKTLKNTVGTKSAQTTNRKQSAKKRETYTFNGSEYYKKGLVVAIVEKYVEDNPIATYNELKRIFDLKFSFNKKPWIRLLSELSQDDIKHKRASIENPITLNDGNIIVINNQIQSNEWPDVLQTAKNLGYTISPK